MNKNKVLDYIKKNKGKIAIIAASTIGAGALVLLSVKGCNSVKQTMASLPVRQLSEREQLLSNVKLATATVTDIWDDGGDPWLILNDLKVSDLGKLSEELIEKIPGVTGDTLITCDMGLLN